MSKKMVFIVTDNRNSYPSSGYFDLRFPEATLTEEQCSQMSEDTISVTNAEELLALCQKWDTNTMTGDNYPDGSCVYSSRGDFSVPATFEEAESVFVACAY